MGKRDLKEVIILNAAEKIFEEVGFVNATMDDIAREASMSKGSIYFYFQSKENLYMAITYRGKMTEAMKSSIYYQKISDIQNVPISLAIKEIERGKRDGSVLNPNKPELLFITAWSTIVGYLKLTTASGKHRSTLHTINKLEWKKYVLQLMRNQLESRV